MAGYGHNYEMMKRPVICYVTKTEYHRRYASPEKVVGVRMKDGSQDTLFRTADASPVRYHVEETQQYSMPVDLTPVLPEYHRRYASPEKVGVRMKDGSQDTLFRTAAARPVRCHVVEEKQQYSRPVDLTPVLPEYHRRYASPEKVVGVRMKDGSQDILFRTAAARPVRYHVEEKQQHSRPVDLTPVLAEYHRRYASPEKVVGVGMEDGSQDALSRTAATSSVRYHVEEKQQYLRPVIRPVVRDDPREVKDFPANVQKEVIMKPNRSYHKNPSYLHHTPNSYQVDDATGHLPSKEWNKLNASDDQRAPTREPPPDALLSKPTNDIHAAMELIRQAAKVSGPDRNKTTSTRHEAKSTDAAMGLIRQAAKVSGPDSRTKGKNEITDSREAQKTRNGNPNLLSQQKEAYYEIIDSKMAAKKYGGTLV